MQLLESRPTGSRRGISLTPLIDVVFILLLFFMLSTRFTQQQALTLDVPAQNGEQSNQNLTLQLRLSDTGYIILEGEERILPASLSSHASLIAAIAEAVPIQLDADDDVPLQQLVLVTDLLEKAGARTVKLTALR